MADELRVTTWSVTEDGLKVYVNGKLVALIEPRSFGNLIYDLARVMRSTK